MRSFLPHSEWGNLEEHLNESFFQPDLEALRVALSVYCAHWLYLNDRPTWPMFIGVPGSGKSEVICTALSGLEGVVVSSEITAHTFISGASSNLNGASLLKDRLLQLPGAAKAGTARTHGILVFKDFTSIMEMRPDYRSAITNQMREIWDGRYDPHKGVKAGVWEGKLTIQAVVTPAFESAWGLKRGLGERFTSWRTVTGDGIGMVYSLLKQKHHNTIAKITRDLTKRVMPSSYRKPPLMPMHFNRVIAHAAQYAAILRGHVERDTYPPRNIVATPQPEAPTRLALSMMHIATGHACLRGSLVVESEDVALALKAAKFSVPRLRLHIIEALTTTERLRSEIVAALGLPQSTINWTVEELVALKAMEVHETDGHVYYKLTATIEENRAIMEGAMVEAETVVTNVVQFPVGAQA